MTTAPMTDREILAEELSKVFHFGTLPNLLREADALMAAGVGLTDAEGLARVQTAEEFVAAVMDKCPKVGNTYQVHASDLIEIASTFGVSS